ncbi:RNA polymerase sigma factor [Mucilaginibacter paludis]|uniref:RNA polymerase, sigma-24 subunit, ECF subfamily n=1 Tax=Mucilaginibacter paludis DSM 18603 TaxID=714943 RepID=H1Y8X9_9SPHI|nr:RNA polymerase sigma-70 factor [Mucilaginibacter paludis]EHQ28745.1 RNA polymerase, sigma-24 subunit, ECF subfamily [Mucilaginibacter paludis DSM 18603]
MQHPYDRLSDLELTKRLRSGDDDAFREIYQRYDKPLYLYAYHKLGSKEEARDVIQDVFAWLLDHRENIDLKTTLSGYLYQSVLHKVFNIFKHQKVLEKYANEEYTYTDIESKETDYLIREKDIIAMVEKEIALMPPRMREIYTLRSKNYMTNKQIAEQLGIAEATVATQIKRAMKHLRVKLGIAVYLLYIINQR